MDRSALAPADVDDATLTAMVADLLDAGDSPVSLLDVRVEPVAYDVPAITTGGRWWVRGEASVGDCTRDFALFVKLVREWSRSPFFAHVPPEARSWAAQQVPWRTEGAAYRSDLADHLPAGLAMPRSLGVHPIDELSYSVWLEVVPALDVSWDLDRYRRAAHLLGRLAGSPAVRGRAGIGGHEWDVHRYVEGRLAFQVLPLLADDGLWQHPLIAPAFGPLRPRLQAAGAAAPELAAELADLPVLVGHGDACPNNLLVRPGHDGFTLIDFGFFTALPVGFDLGQLLVGDVQIGRRGPDDLAERGEACLAAYRDGLAAEGVEIDLSTLRRAHALHLMIFSGLSALPFEMLDTPVDDTTQAISACRAAIARHALDLLDRTA